MSQCIIGGQRKFTVYCCPLTFPFQIALHTRVVITWPDGSTDKYEVHMFKNPYDPGLGYLYHNDGLPHMGIEIYPGIKSLRYKGTVLYHIGGGLGSDAYKICQWVAQHIDHYEYKHLYRHLPGPNCNTFVQWLVDHIGDTSCVLPWNALGKGYSCRQKYSSIM